MTDQPAPDPNQRVVFATGMQPDGTATLVIQIPVAAWEYMQHGRTNNIDLTKLGLPFQIILSGCKDRAEAVKNIETANEMRGHATLRDFTTDFGIKGQKP